MTFNSLGHIATKYESQNSDTIPPPPFQIDTLVFQLQRCQAALHNVAYVYSDHAKPLDKDPAESKSTSPVWESVVLEGHNGLHKDSQVQT